MAGLLGVPVQGLLQLSDPSLLSHACGIGVETGFCCCLPHNRCSEEQTVISIGGTYSHIHTDERTDKVK